MRVILRADVANVGLKGDVLDVADGYARNFLVPRGLALKASPGALAQATAMRRARDARDARDRASAEEIASRLAPTVITIPAKAGAEGRLFGSVTAADLVSAVEAQTGVVLDRRRVHVEDPIKTVGVHEVAVRLHTAVELRLSVEVVAASG
ncbi:MAG TPA: 50S ribosomal protein L9 [Acidimicrobiales bacterium]|nr:50S ribosomal protein L9 [Acidimicrobiales bacterium]